VSARTPVAVAAPVTAPAPVAAPAAAGPAAVHPAAAGSTLDADAGRPLDVETRRDFEPRFGVDFSRVRIHGGAAADRAARGLSAAAVTYGDHVAFRAGRHEPGTPAGRHLVAHELAHVVQQRRPGGGASAASEAAADRAADEALWGGRTPVAVGGATGPTVACQSDAEQERRRKQMEAMLPASVPYMLDPSRLERQYRAALAAARASGWWEDAARILNGFNRIDIQRHLAELTDREVAALHEAAEAARGVGPDSNVANLTAPSVPRASTPPPEQSLPEKSRPTPPSHELTDDDVKGMSTKQRLIAAWDRAPVGAAIRAEIEALVSVEALVTALLAFAVTTVVLELTPAGWIADGIAALFIGPVLFQLGQHIVGYGMAARAKTVGDLDAAGVHLARAIALVTVQGLIAIVLHKTSKGAKTSGAGGIKIFEVPLPKGMGDVLLMSGTVIRMPLMALESPAMAAAVAAAFGSKPLPTTGTSMMIASSPQAAPPAASGGAQASGSGQAAGGPAPGGGGIHGAAPRPAGPQVTGGARPQTAGTGGIRRISRIVDPATGAATTTIEGRLLPKLPSRANLEKWIGPPQPGMDRAHLWGRIFGDEAAAGVLFAPEKVNGGIQLTLEKTLEQLHDDVAAHGGEVHVKATNRSYGRDVMSGKALASVRYEFTIRQADGTVTRTLRVDIDVARPGTTTSPRSPGYEISAPLEGGGAK
jgi:Domain of unknown function (DUF4157)/Bacterial toxin 4